jgi:hypothetical protein
VKTAVGVRKHIRESVCSSFIGLVMVLDFNIVPFIANLFHYLLNRPKMFDFYVTQFV